jgi:hypothetical protein
MKSECYGCVVANTVGCDGETCARDILASVRPPQVNVNEIVDKVAEMDQILQMTNPQSQIDKMLEK